MNKRENRVMLTTEVERLIGDRVLRVSTLSEVWTPKALLLQGAQPTKRWELR